MERPEYSYYYFSELSTRTGTPFIDWSFDTAYNEEENSRMQRCLLASYRSKHMKIQPCKTCINEYGRRILSLAQRSIVTKIETQTTIAEAKFMPRDPRNIAAMSNNGHVALYTLHEDRFIYGVLPEYSRRTLRLPTQSGSSGEVLSWHPLESGILLSATYDGSIMVHDVETGASKNVFSPHSHEPSDGSWNPYDFWCFAIIGEECMFHIWDTRVPRPCLSVRAHHDCSNAIDFAPQLPWVFLTGGSGAANIVWDMRFLARGLDDIKENAGPVLRTKWSPHESRLFASCGHGGEAFIGKFCKNGELEVVFRHTLHKSVVADIKWHPIRNTLTSVDMVRQIHVWQPKMDY